MTRDRARSNQFHLTQDLLANMLGVRREGVTEAAGRLHKAGIIDYYRGRIIVLERDRLEQRACECYAVVRKECERLPPATIAA